MPNHGAPTGATLTRLRAPALYCGAPFLEGPGLRSCAWLLTRLRAAAPYCGAAFLEGPGLRSAPGGYRPAVELSGAAALATGGASGIGEATVAALQAAGARVAVLDLHEAPAAV